MRGPFQSQGAAGVGVWLILACVLATEGCTAIGDVFPSLRGRREGDPSFAPFVVTPPEVVQEMLRLAEVRPDDVVFDLGSGDGRIVITAAREYGARGVGFELEPGLVDRARQDAGRAGVGSLAEFHVQDVMTVDLSGATVVTIYLSREANLKLRPRILSQMRPGARVVSHQFDMGDWPPSRILNYRDTTGGEHTLFLWRIPGGQ
jgi:SAM-dependent methyltransferase